MIVENAKSGKLPDIDKKKFLVPYDLTIAQFHYIIRKRVQLQPETTLFCFVDNLDEKKIFNNSIIISKMENSFMNS